MVQMDEADSVRRQWEQAGRPACAHEKLDREYYLGSNTGDYVCLTCGETFSPAERDALWQAKRNTT
jgi:hypothetical protein